MGGRTEPEIELGMRTLRVDVVLSLTRNVKHARTVHSLVFTPPR